MASKMPAPMIKNFNLLDIYVLDGWVLVGMFYSTMPDFF